jgi:hypothetical protein
MTPQGLASNLVGHIIKELKSYNDIQEGWNKLPMSVQGNVQRSIEALICAYTKVLTQDVQEAKSSQGKLRELTVDLPKSFAGVFIWKQFIEYADIPWRNIPREVQDKIRYAWGDILERELEIFFKQEDPV